MFLTQGITRDGKIDTTNVDRVGLNMLLQKYKHTERATNYGELIKIPSANRIPAMAKTDMRGTVTAISVALTLAMEVLNLKNSMSPIQIVDCAEVIVDSANEDNIALEDVMVFLQKLTRGQYGDMYQSMDQAKIMSMFDKFRDERWAEGIRIRDEKHEEYKQMGDMNIYEREMPRDATPFGEQMKHYRDKVREKNDEIKSLRSELRRKGNGGE